MIKFFRRIRQKLLTENKFSKYLLYAVGEIFLVVIGILIALQINNWNSNRLDREYEIKILNEILRNLETDLENINSKITLNEKFMDANSKVLRHLMDKTPLTDSLKFSYSFLIGHGNFQPITVGYENLKSKGIDIVQNDSLRYAIPKLYDFEYYYFVEDTRLGFIPEKEYLTMQVRQNIVSERPYRSAEPIDLIKLQKDIRFQEALRQAMFIYNWMNSNYKRGIMQIEEVIQQIKRELKHR